MFEEQWHYFLFASLVPSTVTDKRRTYELSESTRFYFIIIDCGESQNWIQNCFELPLSPAWDLRWSSQLFLPPYLQSTTLKFCDQTVGQEHPPGESNYPEGQGCTLELEQLSPEKQSAHSSNWSFLCHLVGLELEQQLGTFLTKTV